MIVIVGAVVLLYLVIRLVTWSGEQSGTMGLGGKRCYHVFGYTRDPMYQRLKCWARELYKETGISPQQVQFDFKGPVTKEDYRKQIGYQVKVLGEKAKNHKSPPLVWQGCYKEEYDYVGASDELISVLKQRHRMSGEGCW